MITVTLVGAAERAQRFADAAGRLAPRLAAEAAQIQGTRAAPIAHRAADRLRRGRATPRAHLASIRRAHAFDAGARGDLARARQAFRSAAAPDAVEQLDAAVMEELEA